jgi:hypothetical protein
MEAGSLAPVDRLSFAARWDGARPVALVSYHLPKGLDRAGAAAGMLADGVDGLALPPGAPGRSAAGARWS